jgi:triacylglycerol esterase/lipase EstA (alpha/beta hydrolase family)
MWPWLLLLSASATTDFDATAPEQIFSGVETFTTDGTAQLWGAIERHHDGDTTLFGPQQFNDETAWPDDSPYTPYISTCFGTPEPEAGSFLLHVGLGAQLATGTPVLFVPGAGDNASRGFVLMVIDFVLQGRPVYGITFSHPHGDVFEQAEIVADAIARIKERTGAEQVDVVSHSKGGIASAIYLSHTADADWGNPAYEAAGTPYRGDVRRAVFIATPLDGVDTAYRWPGINYASLDADAAVSPASWDSYYPATTAVILNETSLSRQDFFPGGGDLFPGQRQLLKAQPAELPGNMPWLGVYAMAQQDWYTTWHGGLGFYSESRGIEAATEAGGNVIDRIAAQGVDPSVEVFLLAGRSPLLTNGTWLLAQQLYDSAWLDIAASGIDVWSALITAVTSRTFPNLQVSDADLQGLSSGKLILGEITAPSDGLVMLRSATREQALNKRGAQIIETRIVELSHLDLLYANPDTAQSLRDQAELDPVQYGWTLGLADRYEASDTIGWLAAVLADPVAPGGEDTDVTTDTDAPISADDTDLSLDDGLDVPPGVYAGCECDSAAKLRFWPAAVMALAGLRRRRSVR